MHLALSSSLHSPFDAYAVLDDDAGFALRTIVALGPFARQWRRRQLRAMKCLDRALGDANRALVSSVERGGFG